MLSITTMFVPLDIGIDTKHLTRQIFEHQMVSDYKWCGESYKIMVEINRIAQVLL